MGIKAPVAQRKFEITIDGFNGIDLRNSPSKVAENRSPMCVNMIRDTKGSNQKRTGYETLGQMEGRINGIHVLKGKEERMVIHSGTKYFLFNQNNTSTLLYDKGNDNFSVSTQFDSKLYILDGANYIMYDGTTMKKVTEIAYIPTIIIARKWNGGGALLEPVNLITPFRTEKFTGDSSNRTFQLTATGIDVDEVKIKSLESNGKIIDLKEGSNFTVDRPNGKFTLNSAKPTPVAGEDNLYVTYAKKVDGYAEKIEKCDIATLYGVNGLRDRLFISGNPDYPHYDWYSRSDDPTYFGDTWYSVVGQDSSKIIGYSIINDCLVTHKDTSENDSNANIRKGDFENNAAVFKSTGSFMASGALAKHAFASINNEPLYLTLEKNISAITPSDVIGERFSQERSYYISSALAKETELENAYATVFNGFYMLAVRDKIYILDSTQPVYEKSAPYSTRQFECYLWTGIGARVLKTYNNQLYFGTADGKLKRFMPDGLQSYTDDSKTHENKIVIDSTEVTTRESFPCYWDTCEFYGAQNELKKTFRHLAVLLASHPKTGCRIWAKIDGIWEILFDYDESANFMDFNTLDFSRFTFRTDDTPTVVGGKFKVKNVLHIQLRFENSRPEPFGVYFAKLKYTIGNEYIK